MLRMIGVWHCPLMSPYGDSRGEWVNQKRVILQNPLKTPVMIIV